MLHLRQVTTITVNAVPLPAAPIASFTNVTPSEGIAPLTVSFNADASTSDPAVMGNLEMVVRGRNVLLAEEPEPHLHHWR